MQEKSFKSEEDLFKLFFKHKVFFAQGSVFYSTEPGWFRIIFTQKLEVLQVGMYKPNIYCYDKTCSWKLFWTLVKWTRFQYRAMNLPD